MDAVRQILARLAAHSDPARLHRVDELAMTAPLGGKHPSVAPQELQYLAYFWWHVAAPTRNRYSLVWQRAADCHYSAASPVGAHAALRSATHHPISRSLPPLFCLPLAALPGAAPAPVLALLLRNLLDSEHVRDGRLARLGHPRLAKDALLRGERLERITPQVGYGSAPELSRAFSAGSEGGGAEGLEVGSSPMALLTTE